ncbi:MAG: hypothetical protein ACLPVY_23045 [Acidimicrobiia bacterium]
MPASADDGLRAALQRFEQSTKDQRRALEDLVRTLRSHLGLGAVRVSRRGLWGFGRLESARFIVGDHSYRVTVRGGKVTAEIGDAVGGVGLTPHAVTWTDWVQRLNDDVDATIEENP